MVDDDTRVLTLEPAPAPNGVTLEVPIIPGAPLLPWVDPRRYESDGPVWDATDELFITYDPEGNRVLTTTGETDIFATEHSYQRTGSARYDELRNLGGVGGRAGGQRGGSRPGWSDPTAREHPPVHAHHNGYHPREGLDGGTGDHHKAGGDGAHGTPRHARHSAARRGVPQRSRADLAAEQRVRSHRHCPGCSGHANARRSGWGLFGRAIGAWLLVYWGLFTAGVGVTLAQYFILTALGFAAALLFRPVWREFANSEDRHTKGGRR